MSTQRTNNSDRHLQKHRCRQLAEVSWPAAGADVGTKIYEMCMQVITAGLKGRLSHKE
jgi:hypothetical protein